MQTIIRKSGDEHNVEFIVDIIPYGKGFDDIEEAFFSVKKTLTDEDDAYFFKHYKKGSILPEELGITLMDLGTTVRVSVIWLATEYTTIPVGTYEAGVFLKFTGNTAADENIEDTFILDLRQGFMKDH